MAILLLYGVVSHGLNRLLLKRLLLNRLLAVIPGPCFNGRTGSNLRRCAAK
jgi:hypothetical protein